MKIHELKKVRSDSKSLRVGRGISAGGGKTAGRGTKGQKSRSGHNIPRKFEGGQTPLNMRLHKLSGFKSLNHGNKIITLSDISKNFKDGETVSNKSLETKGLMKKGESVKILANGELSVKVIFSDVKKSKNVDFNLPKEGKSLK
jgi:large subunit ribosomal protein L15